MNPNLLFKLFPFAHFVLQWQELTLLSELQIHVCRLHMSRGSVCNVWAGVSLLRTVSWVPPVPADEWRHRVSREGPVPRGQVCALLWDSGHAELYVWHQWVSCVVIVLGTLKPLSDGTNSFMLIIFLGLVQAVNIFQGRIDIIMVSGIGNLLSCNCCRTFLRLIISQEYKLGPVYFLTRCFITRDFKLGSARLAYSALYCVIVRYELNLTAVGALQTFISCVPKTIDLYRL